MKAPLVMGIVLIVALLALFMLVRPSITGETFACKQEIRLSFRDVYRSCIPITYSIDRVRCVSMSNHQLRVALRTQCEGCIAKKEVCDNKDNDCDGFIDEYCGQYFFPRSHPREEFIR